MRSWMISLRLGALCVVSTISLVRCSMSKLVIGAPLTITATDCAEAGVATPASASAARPIAAIVTGRKTERTFIVETVVVPGLMMGRAKPAGAGQAYCVGGVTLALVLPMVRSPSCT